MTTRITPTHAINGLKQRAFPINKTNYPKTKRKTKSKSSSATLQSLKRKPVNPLNDLKMSLRQECLQLASFLKQETHRPGYVR